MDLLNRIQELEETEDVEKCYKCTEFRNGYDGPYCMFLERNCDPEGCCSSFTFAEFWDTKRGY